MSYPGKKLCTEALGVLRGIGQCSIEHEARMIGEYQRFSCFPGSKSGLKILVVLEETEATGVVRDKALVFYA